MRRRNASFRPPAELRIVRPASRSDVRVLVDHESLRPPRHRRSSSCPPRRAVAPCRHTGLCHTTLAPPCPTNPPTSPRSSTPTAPHLDRDRPAPIYDADSIRLDIDLGFGIWKHAEMVRLARIDAWEVRDEERVRGLAARDFVRDLLPPGADILIETIKDTRGKYGRYLAEIHLDDGTMLSDLLVEQGHAEYASY